MIKRSEVDRKVPGLDATVTDWITAAFTVVLAGFTAALVVVTARYVTQTRNLVSETQKSRDEARCSRELSVLPKLVIDLDTITGMFVGLKLTNVGQGPALEVKLIVAFEPAEGSSLPRDERPWRANVLARNEWVRFVPPRSEQGVPLEVPALGRAYKEATVKGRMHDALGRQHEVDERVSDLAGLHELTTQAMVLLEKDRVAEELRKLRKSADGARRELRRTRRGPHQPERPAWRSRLTRALGRSGTKESVFAPENWWGRQSS